MLDQANRREEIVRTTIFEFDTTISPGGILNVPFIERQADTTEMKSTFWVQELGRTHADGSPQMRLQYSQVVMLDFFPRVDGMPGLIMWPHVSIHTLAKVAPG